jgi:NtrC-family two-component system sensor histidine kinase KinB
MKSIWYKIGIGYFVLVCLTIATSIVAIYNFSKLNDFITSILNVNYQGVLAAENMVKSLERQENAQLSMLSEDVDSSFVQFTINIDGFRSWRHAALELSTDQREFDLLESIGETYDMYVQLTDSLHEILSLRNGRTKGTQYKFANLRPIAYQLKEKCFRLFEMNQIAMNNTEDRIKATATDATFTVIFASIIAVILSVFASIRTTRTVLIPARRLTATVRRIGQGHLNQKIDVTTDDEIGLLAAEFNKMTERLRSYEEMNIHQLISEKKKSESIVESIADPIVVTDNEDHVVLMNKAAAEMLDVETDNILGKSLSSVLRDERWAKRLSTSAIDREEPVQRDALLSMERDNKRLYFRPRQTKIVDAEGHIEGVITLLQDVTRFKDLDAMKTDFLATVSHEFRTPLTSINMTVDILSKEVIGSINQKQRELLDDAKDDCERLGKLVKDLLDLSKLESGKHEMRKEPIKVRELIEDSLKPLRLQFGEKHLSIIVDVGREINEISGDRQQLAWVMTNLASNALRFSPDRGSVRIVVERTGDGIRFAVTDTGRGIPLEAQPNIFDKFVQVKEPAETTPGSVGLGLAIAREVVVAHGGKIWVESAEGEGSTFYFVVPLKS